jgi:uncharacterized protein
MAQSKRRTTSQRGFASMDKEKQREIAAKGGQSVPPEERSFAKDPELATEAGKKGGKRMPPEERSFSKDHELAAEAGAKRGKSSSHEQHVRAGQQSHKSD